jgi:hypothetical protein
MEKTKQRDVINEQDKVQIGSTPAASSHQALFYHLIDPDTIRSVARRKTVGAIKFGSVQYRQGLTDPKFVADRLNHFIEHLLQFLESGDTFDDNSGAMLWFLDMVQTIKRECPEVLEQVFGTSKLIGEAATIFHNAEMAERTAKQPGNAEVKSFEDTLEDCHRKRHAPFV